MVPTGNIGFVFYLNLVFSTIKFGFDIYFFSNKEKSGLGISYPCHRVETISPIHTIPLLNPI